MLFPSSFSRLASQPCRGDPQRIVLCRLSADAVGPRLDFKRQRSDGRDLQFGQTQGMLQFVQVSAWWIPLDGEVAKCFMLTDHDHH